MNWPESEAGGCLGCGRNALATYRPESVDAVRGVVIERTALGEAIYPQGGGDGARLRRDSWASWRCDRHAVAQSCD